MADTDSSIFNKKASDKLRSADDLDKYLRVTNPSVWVMLFACMSLLAGLLSWGVFGTVTTNVSTMGAIVDGKTLCYLPTDDAESVKIGDSVTVEGKPMAVAEISSTPLSRKEVTEELKSEYLVSRLVQNNWSYRLHLEGDATGLARNVPLDVDIMTDSCSPISLLFKDDD